MNDLSFCGFITLKNKLKNEIKSAIQDLKELDCNLIITSGDNVNNSLSVGFDSGIIENKNVFVFEKEDDENKISIRKIYMVKNEKEESDNEGDNLNSSGELSKYTSKRSQNKSNYSPVKHSLKYNLSFIRSSKTKKIISKKNKPFIGNNNQNNQNKDITAEQFTPQTPKITFENHKYNQNRILQKRNFFKSSKMLFDKSNLNSKKSTDKENLIN